MIDDEQAVMFGEFLQDRGHSSDVYVLHLPTMVIYIYISTIIYEDYNNPCVLLGMLEEM